ncbi:MAG TPA: GntR family transcriptional regulator [Alphaproteobacteria bacterium]
MQKPHNQKLAKKNKKKKRSAASKKGRPRRPSLYQEIADIICDRIVDGSLAAGSFIDEPALADELEVSRTPVREALKALAMEGLVDIFPNQGSYVAKITAEDARELIELLALLEGFAGALACQRGSDEMLKSLTRMHEDMVQAYRQGDKPTYFKLNQRIHDEIVAAARNKHLIDVHRRCTRRLRRIRYLSNLQKAAWERSVADHGAMLQALTARDATATRRIMTDHAADIWDTVRASLA